MLSFLFLFLANLASDPAMDKASDWMRSGNYLMAEAELLQADPSQDPVRIAEMLFEIAVRTNSVSSKQQFIRESLMKEEGWALPAQLANLALALQQRDWETFASQAGPFLNDTSLRDHPTRLRVLYHVGRHTLLEDGGFLLSPNEKAWLEVCRTLAPNRTWPQETSPGLPFLFQHGHLLEKGTPFAPPEPSQPSSNEDNYAAQVLRARNLLNQADLDGAATAINLMMAKNAQSPAYLKTFFYQVTLEYFQRKDLMAQASKTATNLAVVRKRAFFPIQNWPDRVVQIQRQRSERVLAATPKPISELAPAVAMTETPVAESVNTGEPATVEAKTDEISKIDEPKPEEPVLTTPPPPKPDPIRPEIATVDATTAPSEASPEPEPVSTSVQNSVEPPTVQTTPLAEAASEETAMPPTSEATENIETTPPSDVPSQTLPMPLPDEPAEADPNLALARALMADGDTLMAEAQFMAVQPRRQDVLMLGTHLAELALQTDTLANKTTFFSGYLQRTDAWRGVALTILAIFSARQQDWPSYENYGLKLFEEYGPLPDDIRFRFIYYLARFTTTMPKQLRPVEALWFQKSRDLPQYGVFPKITQPGVPFAYRWARLLDNRQFFEMPSEPVSEDEEGRYLWHLLKIRNALNSEELNLAATEINALKALPQKGLDTQWRSLFQEISTEYFEKRGEVEKALVARRNADHYANRTVLKLQSIPTRTAQVAELLSDRSLVNREPALPKPETTTAPTVATPSASPDPKPVETDRNEQPVMVQGDMDWVGLEKALHRGARNLELQIRAKETDTTYSRIFKAYLLGTIYLSKGRFQSAYERLTLAENLVRELPFPVLESKVLLAMADYYDAERNAEQANWYRIAAVQLWNQPANLPIFASKNNTVRRSPFPELLDQSLKTVTQKGSIHTLIYYSELEAFLTLREQAYTREVISANTVLSSQLKQVGGTIATMVETLATQPDAEVTPRRFNDTQALWSGLWDGVFPYYQGENVPGLGVVQNQLTPDERLLIFIEGSQLFGVLYITQNQNFAVGLGNKANFLNLDPEAQFDFLEGRLGPVWNHTGALTVQLSNSLRQQVLLDHLMKRMPDPSRLRFTSSLKALTIRNSQQNCGARLYIDPKSQSIANTEETASQSRILNGSQITRSNVLAEIENHGHVYLEGNIAIEKEGLIYQPGSLDIKLHELPRYQPNLCSLTLIVPAGPSFLALLDGLSLIQISSGPAIQIRTDWPTAEQGTPDYSLLPPRSKIADNEARQEL